MSLEKSLIKVIQKNNDDSGNSDTMLYIVHDQKTYPNGWVAISMRAIEPNNKNYAFESEMNFILSKKRYETFLLEKTRSFDSDYYKSMEIVAE
jgi:hypothetical protein